MPQFLLSILGQLGTSIGYKLFGLLTAAIMLPIKLLKEFTISAIASAKNSVLSLNQMAITSSRQIGMNYRDSIAYTRTLINRTKDLSIAYGITAEQISKIQDGLVRATGRAQILSYRQAELFGAISKVIGEDIAQSYASTMVREMGATLTESSNAAIAAYTKATKVGLSATEFSKKVSENLSLANRVSFSRGVEGITKMTALSEKLGFNLQSIEGVVNNFTDFQNAITNSARLQALGGMAGIYGANPLTMMYESLNDVESLTERITQMVQGMATWDPQKNMAVLRGYNLEMVKEIARALGMNESDAVAMAKNQAKASYIESRAGGQLDQFRDNQELRDWIVNKADITENGKLTITDANGQIHELAKMERGELEKMWRESQMSDKEAFLEGARTIVSVEERIAGISNLIGAMLAERVLPILQLVQEFLINEGVRLGNIMARGMVMLITPGFWRNIGIELVKYMAAGLTYGIFQAAMFLAKTWLGIGSVLLGGLNKIFGIFGDSDSLASKIAGLADGSTYAKLAYEGVGKLFNKDREVERDMSVLKQDALSLFRDTKNNYGERLKDALNGARSASEPYIQELRKFNTHDVYDAESRRVGGSENMAVLSQAARQQQSAERVQVSIQQPKSENASALAQADKQQAAANGVQYASYEEEGARAENECTVCGIISAIEAQTNIFKNFLKLLFGVESREAITSNHNPSVQYVQLSKTPPIEGVNGIGTTEEYLAVDESKVYRPTRGEGEQMDANMASFNPLGMAVLPMASYAGFKMYKGARGIFGGLKALVTPNKPFIANGLGIDRNPHVIPHRNGLINGFTANQNNVRVGGFSGVREPNLPRPSASQLSNTKNGLKPRGYRNVPTKGFGIGKIGGSIGLGIAGVATDSLTSSLIKGGAIDYGGFGHYAGRGTSNALQFAAMGAMFGGLPGAAIGGVLGLGYGLFSAAQEAKEARETQLEREREYQAKMNVIIGDIGGTDLSQIGRTDAMIQSAWDSIAESSKAEPSTSIKKGVFEALMESKASAIGNIEMAEAVEPRAKEGRSVRPKPVGEETQFVASTRGSKTQTAPSKLDIDDINVNLNINGVLRLDGGNASKSIDGKTLLTNVAFVNELTNVIRSELSKYVNGGKVVRDVSYQSGRFGMNPIT